MFLLCTKLLSFFEHPNTFFFSAGEGKQKSPVLTGSVNPCFQQNPDKKTGEVSQERSHETSIIHLKCFKYQGQQQQRGYRPTADQNTLHKVVTGWPCALTQRAGNVTSAGIPHSAYPQPQPSGVVWVKLISPLQGHVFTSATDWTGWWSFSLHVIKHSWPLCVTWTKTSHLEIGLIWVNVSKHEKR